MENHTKVGKFVLKLLKQTTTYLNSDTSKNWIVKRQNFNKMQSVMSFNWILSNYVCNNLGCPANLTFSLRFKNEG